MNDLTQDSGTMAGMSDEHLMSSVDGLLTTPLERELFKRLSEHTSEYSELVEILGLAGFDDPDDLREYLDHPGGPTKDELDPIIDDALYLLDYRTVESVRKLLKSLKEFQERLC